MAPKIGVQRRFTLLNGITPKARVTNDAVASPHGPCSQTGFHRHQWVYGLSLRQPSAVGPIYLFLTGCVAHSRNLLLRNGAAGRPKKQAQNPRPPIIQGERCQRNRDRGGTFQTR